VKPLIAAFRFLTPRLAHGIIAPCDTVGVITKDEAAEIDHIEALLQEAVDSGDYIELDEAEWARMEDEALAEVRARATARAMS
jgi:hypothetical protein